jgi:hypothetical protein
VEKRPLRDAPVGTVGGYRDPDVHTNRLGAQVKSTVVANQCRRPTVAANSPQSFRLPCTQTIFARPSAAEAVVGIVRDSAE